MTGMMTVVLIKLLIIIPVVLPFVLSYVINDVGKLYKFGIAISGVSAIINVICIIPSIMYIYENGFTGVYDTPIFLMGNIVSISVFTSLTIMFIKIKTNKSVNKNQQLETKKYLYDLKKYTKR